jgi:hypothetical protein
VVRFIPVMITYTCGGQCRTQIRTSQQINSEAGEDVFSALCSRRLCASAVICLSVPCHVRVNAGRVMPRPPVSCNQCLACWKRSGSSRTRSRRRCAAS